jgi:hypothetical protein
MAASGLFAIFAAQMNNVLLAAPIGLLQAVLQAGGLTAHFATPDKTGRGIGVIKTLVGFGR